MQYGITRPLQGLDLSKGVTRYAESLPGRGFFSLSLLLLFFSSSPCVPPPAEVESLVFSTSLQQSLLFCRSLVFSLRLCLVQSGLVLLWSGLALDPCVRAHSKRPTTTRSIKRARLFVDGLESCVNKPINTVLRCLLLQRQ